MNEPGTLLIRADASEQIGTGHVMRCLALAQAWQDAGGDVIFLIAQSTASVRRRLSAEQCEVISIAVRPGSAQDAHQTTEFALRYKAEWVAIDGYKFDAEFQRRIRSEGHKLLCIDDEGSCGEYVADIVLNQNLNAQPSWYGTRGEEQLLVGPQFCLLRREFSPWREWRRTISDKAGKILVTLGGSTPVESGRRVIAAVELAGIEGVTAVFAVGGSTPDIASLKRCAAESSVRISVQTDVGNMPSLMAQADVAISAAGSTCWELCLLGLPAVLIDVAENQSPVARELHRRGCALHVGSAATVSAEQIASAIRKLIESPELRESISLRARELVDGRGAERVIAAMLRVGRGMMPEVARSVSA